jgi:hypothetical protein
MKASDHLLVGALKKPVKTSNPIADQIREEHFELYNKKVIPLAVEELKARLKDSPDDAQACELDQAFYWDMLRPIADSIAVDNLIIPPGWNGSVNCIKCGLVPYLENFKGETLVGCPWCHSEGMKRTTTALKRLSVSPDLEAMELRELVK